MISSLVVLVGLFMPTVNIYQLNFRNSGPSSEDSCTSFRSSQLLLTGCILGTLSGLVGCWGWGCTSVEQRDEEQLRTSAQDRSALVPHHYNSEKEMMMKVPWRTYKNMSNSKPTIAWALKWTSGLSLIFDYHQSDCTIGPDADWIHPAQMSTHFC